MLKQVAVYWEPKGKDQYGEEFYHDPVEIKCRWEEEATQGFPFDGKETVYSTTVFMDREPAIGGLLIQGKLADLPGPQPHENAHRILFREVVPTLDAKQFLNVAKF
jgi:hypothetical protein